MNETFANTLPKVFKGWLLDLHTAIPAKVEKYDSGKLRVDVTPLVATLTRSGTIVEIGTISDVPVMAYGGSAAIIDIELQKGDNGLLVFCEKGIGGWKSSDGSRQVDPDDRATHNISNAIFIPGLFPDGKSSEISNLPRIKVDKDKNIEIDNTSGKIILDGNSGQCDINGHLTVDV